LQEISEGLRGHGSVIGRNYLGVRTGERLWNLCQRSSAQLAI